MNPYKNMVVGFVLALNALACHGCSDDFDPSSRVVNLRVIAVQADRPSAAPGQQVRLDALYFDPEGRALSWAWGLCGSEASSSALSCAQTLDLRAMSIGQASSFEFTVPAAPAGSTAYDSVGIAVIACPGTLQPGDTVGIPVSCVDASGLALDINAFEVGMKRVFVRDHDENHNPQIEMVLWDGERWPEGELREAGCDADGKKCKKHKLEVRAPDAQERATDVDGRSIQEQAVTQFYATGGTFEDDVRVVDEADTTWQPRAEDRGQVLTLWFVVRDDRGGVTWTERQVRVP
ncbi:MAG: hypothetical protein QM778_14455 [Myxococcales bacterium]